MILTAKEVSARLADDLENVLAYLAPAAKKEGALYLLGSVAGEPGKSLKINAGGKYRGHWRDYNESGGLFYGDLLDLWKHTKYISEKAAYKEALEYLGVSNSSLTGFTQPQKARPTKKVIPDINHDKHARNYLINRGIDSTVINFYQVSQDGDKIVFPSYCDGELIHIKYRNISDKRFSTSKDTQACLFGWQAEEYLRINTKTNPKSIQDISEHDYDKTRFVVLCEGEIDALSWATYGYFALSLPFGAGGGRKVTDWLSYEKDRLAQFDIYYLSMDMDDAGQSMIEELVKHLGHEKCRIVKLPRKDCNECLVDGLDISDSIKNAKRNDPIEFQRGDAFLDIMMESFYPTEQKPEGYKTPFSKSKSDLLFRPGELIIWSGINGHGKSQLLGQVALSIMEQGGKVCIASLEMMPRTILKRLSRQAGAIEQPSREYLKAISKWYGGKLWLFDFVGVAERDRLIEVFKHAAMYEGVDTFIIDSYMKLDIAEDDYKTQKDFINKLCDFKNHFNVQIHLVVHPRKGTDEGHRPNKLDVKGSGAVTDMADTVLGVWRNKPKEQLQQKVNLGQIALNEKEHEHDALWYCDKQRNGEWEGAYGLFFDKASMQYREAQSTPLHRYVEFNKDEHEDIRPYGTVNY